MHNPGLGLPQRELCISLSRAHFAGPPGGGAHAAEEGINTLVPFFGAEGTGPSLGGGAQ